MRKRHPSSRTYARLRLTKPEFHAFFALALASKKYSIEHAQATPLGPEKTFHHERVQLWEKLIPDKFGSILNSTDSPDGVCLCLTESEFHEFRSLAEGSKKAAFQLYYEAQLPDEQKRHLECLHSWEKIIDEKFESVLIADTSQDAEVEEKDDEEKD